MRKVSRYQETSRPWDRLDDDPTTLTTERSDVPESTIIYTYTDEAPALATASFLPIVQAFAGQAGVDIETRDISLAGRVLAAFPQRLTPEQQVGDALAELGGLATLPEANIIKLPNISASIPQLKAAIAELQAAGYDIPDYPDEPSSVEEKDVRARYDRIKGSAVNPVLREGNSDRRAPLSVKQYARKHPHRNKPFPTGSKTRVATMGHDDFKSNEKSWVAAHDDMLTIRHVAEDGTVTVLKENLKVLPREIIDRHLPLGGSPRRVPRRDPRDGPGRGRAVLGAPQGHDDEGQRPDHLRPRREGLPRRGVRSSRRPDRRRRTHPEQRPRLDPRGPVERRRRGGDRGRDPRGAGDGSAPVLWGVDGGEDDTLAVIPDSSYAGVYQAVIDDVIANGPLDPATIGTVPNVGLMAQAAEEYGSHDKTFEIAADGRVEIVDGDGEVVIEHDVRAGDIWRATQTKYIAVVDWVALAVRRARATGAPAVFWLDVNRAHDAQVIAKVYQALATMDTRGLELSILSPAEATRYTLARLRHGLDTISVTGNVLRDYLTDLFPILEVGTSAKMLSIVPLLAGGGLFETGAGGSAPKHVEQLLAEDYLRWDSLGEFFALAASLEHYAGFTGNAKAQVLADTLDAATGTFLENDKSPGRALGTIDNRGSHFYLALYWAQELAAQEKDAELAAAFAPVAEALAANEEEIVAELIAAQGSPVDIGGYYRPDADRVAGVMRPSETLNAIVDGIA
ncbi:hypothetical protein LUZ63_020881 [Rhynchospora breviuscula]|uniref:Isocitrate dehydrogenase (NADP(+)) n=1 Tax=Rhynchospora breviuscula TaxID=2022672 RepID=A0A9P9Z7P9_9POAL|nr:hypothetical protein LUZ63_020881 [Rhynchospora breviuscula]